MSTEKQKAELVRENVHNHGILIQKITGLEERIRILEALVLKRPINSVPKDDHERLPVIENVTVDLSDHRDEIRGNTVLSSLYDFDEEHFKTIIKDLGPTTQGQIHSSQNYIYTGGERGSCWRQFLLVPAILEETTFPVGIYIPAERRTEDSNRAIKHASTVVHVAPSRPDDGVSGSYSAYGGLVLSIAMGHPNIYFVIKSMEPLFYCSPKFTSLINKSQEHTNAERQEECHALVTLLLEQYASHKNRAKCYYETVQEFMDKEFYGNSDRTFGHCGAPIGRTVLVKWGCALLEKWDEMKTDISRMIIAAYWYMLQDHIPEEYKIRIHERIEADRLLYEVLEGRKSLTLHEEHVLGFLGQFYIL